jgi:hypothetical protein
MLCGSLNFQKTIVSGSFNYLKIKELSVLWKLPGKWVYIHVDNHRVTNHNFKSHPTLEKTAFTFGEANVEWLLKICNYHSGS